MTEAGVDLQFARLREGDEDVPLPRHATEGAAGMDVHAAVPTPVVLEPGWWASVPTGLAVAILLWLITAAIGMTGHLAADVPIGVLAIDAVFQLVFLGVMGAVIGGWQA